ncbi:hypothetical protein PoB_000461800 [Plakobranchus ocellatus]|uniref:Uncharacterized protein n=1 Tax=Plakobranchus ocellatus TaxID=259542 RepID=A0AAV3Y7E7_9GAST|nr:hypothetical protein PoB_000461800 [Plakobranchus ocellatus]
MKVETVVDGDDKGEGDDDDDDDENDDDHHHDNVSAQSVNSQITLPAHQGVNGKELLSAATASNHQRNRALGGRTISPEEAAVLASCQAPKVVSLATT